MICLTKGAVVFMDFSGKLFIKFKRNANYTLAFICRLAALLMLNEPQRIAERELDKFIEPKKNILVFWDDHSDYWIGIEDYFKKCGKRVVLKCSGKEFLEMKNDLPDDVYITDHSISFLVAYTHSYFDAKTRFCSVAKV